MQKKKILFVFGTRPEAIKMAPVILKFQEEKSLTTRILLTAQHRSMLDSVLALFNLKADYDLNILSKANSLSTVTANILLDLENVFKQFLPELILVHGDTNTTMSASLAAFYHKINIAHIEAGLRTYNIFSPYPEEANRRITALLANLHFAPTNLAKANLLKEGIDSSKIIVTGNTVIDALLLAQNLIPNKIEKQFSFLDKSKKLILVTGHRRENFGQGFLNICNAIKELANNLDVQIVYPVHLNPNVKDLVYQKLSNLKNVFLLKPLDYLPFVYLMKKAYLILTDSGGIQEEAPALGKPVLVMRDTTERPEAIEAKTAKLVGTSEKSIVQETNNLLNDQELYKQMSTAINPYGDGKASEKILETILKTTLL